MLCTQKQVTFLKEPGLKTLALTDDYLFGSIELPSCDIGQATRSAYRTLTALLRKHPRYRLVRIWHYFPGINLVEDQLERYQQFSKARYEVLSASGYAMASDLPAASAVGSDHGPLTLHFLAGSGIIEAIENPRQTSAYLYPEIYGPRSPAFTRAVHHQGNNYRHLFISGTASIIGHETVAPFNPEKQMVETLINLETLIASAKFPPIGSKAFSASWCVYLRNPEDFPLIRDMIEKEFHHPDSIVYLRGDLCRSDLAVEIEGFLSMQEPSNIHPKDL